MDQQSAYDHIESTSYITLVVYALVFWIFLGAFMYIVEQCSRRGRVRQEEHRQLEERRRERHLRMLQLHQILSGGQTE